jgi:hypothetical protein
MERYVALWLAPRRPEPVRAVATLGTKLVWTPEIAAKVDETAKAYRQVRTGELAVLPRTPPPLEQVDPVRLAAAISDAVAHG